MHIHEAVKQALDNDKCIKLKGEFFRTKIKPTNTYECCLIIPERNDRKSGVRWNPTALDLTSDEWEVVD